MTWAADVKRMQAENRRQLLVLLFLTALNAGLVAVAVLS